MTDPIADMLTQIRNALAVKKEAIVLPMSKIKYNIAKIFEREGLVEKIEVLKIQSKKNKSAIFDELKIVLKYKKNNQPAITFLKRISKPGLRTYVNKENLPRVLNNLGIAIISTSNGLITNKEAAKLGIGGEVICEIY
ncbi:MAG: 30S ribosomal protein S8 [Patescibacteria group bacterium]|nr:30S ribosomal protein S8 [Patescibacteria group bacterium]MBU1871044.1 30S ribosomal protein S8 [Patescibacteria group bacterium]